MFEFIKTNYGKLFTSADLPGFVAAGWLTQEQADRLVTKPQAQLKVVW